MTEFFIAFSLSFGFLILLPLGEGSNWPSRMLIAFVLGFVLMPHMQINHSSSYIIVAFERFLAGIVISIPVSLMVEYSASLGELIDTGRGQMIAQVYDPIMNHTYSQLAILFKNGYWALLLASGALCRAVELLVDTGNVLDCYSGVGMLHIQRLAMAMLSVSTLFSAAFIASDSSLALVSKIGRGIPINLINFSAKLVIAFCLLYFASFYNFEPQEILAVPRCSL